VDSLDEYTTPLETVDPSASLTGLDFLRSDLADVSVIGMGEATHGTREFFQFKHRLFRFLVEELGVRVFTWEANFAETLAIDRYIRTGEGDPTEAIATVYFWIWYVESVLEMVEWMRDFNEGREPDDKIRFYGVDVQYARGQIDALQRYFDAVDDDFLDSYSTAVSDLRSEAPQEDEAALDRARQLVSALQDHLDANESAFATATTKDEYELARQHARVLDQYLTLTEERLAGDTQWTDSYRDRAMAENTRWVLEHEDADQVALWMHNWHVNRNHENSAGGFLADWYGGDYYVVGMEFSHGSFQAREFSDQSEGPPDSIEKFTVEPAPLDSLPGVLSGLEMPYAFVDLNAASTNERLARWLARPRERTLVGAGYNPTRTGFRFFQDSIRGDFDGLLFVEETNRARPL
jgi:erythromycin esterase